MGPENHSIAGRFQATDKLPPFFSGFSDYQLYRKIVILRDATTSITPPRRAPASIGQITGKAQVAAKTLSLSGLTSEVNVTSLPRAMDKKFGLHTKTLLHNITLEFFDYQQDKSLLDEESAVDFYSRLDKISELDMNEELKSLTLLKQANLSSHDRNEGVSAASESYSLEALARSLKNAFHRMGFPSVSKFINHTRYRPLLTSATRNSVNCTCRNTHVKVHTRLSSPDSLMFYIYMNTDNLNSVPGAVIDCGFCRPVVEKETLDEVM